MPDKALAPLHTPEQIRAMALDIVKSGLFPQIKEPAQAVTLMLLCQAEGLHPIQALRQYNIIQGQPALKADAMLARFQERGGKVKWLRMDDEVCQAEFMASGLAEPVKIGFTMDDAKQAGLTGKQSWRQYPRAMLRARVISEGVRASDPAVNSGLYTVEEVQDFEMQKHVRGFVKGVPKEEAVAVPDAAVEVEGTEKAEPEPVDEEPPAIFGPPEHTPEEARKLIQSIVPDGEDVPEEDGTLTHLRERGLGQRCAKEGCKGSGATFTVSKGAKTGHVYIQCTDAHKLKLEAREAGWTDEAIRELIKGHLFAWV